MSIAGELRENRAVYRLLTGQGQEGEISPLPLPERETGETQLEAENWTEGWDVPAPPEEEAPPYRAGERRPQAQEYGEAAGFPGEVRRAAGPVYSLGRVISDPEPLSNSAGVEIGEMVFPEADRPERAALPEADLLEELAVQMERRQRLYPQDLAGEE